MTLHAKPPLGVEGLSWLSRIYLAPATATTAAVGNMGAAATAPISSAATISSATSIHGATTSIDAASIDAAAGINAAAVVAASTAILIVRVAVAAAAPIISASCK